MAVLFGITVPVVQWLIKTGEGIGKGPVPHTLRDPKHGGVGVGLAQTDRHTDELQTPGRRGGSHPHACKASAATVHMQRKPLGTPPHLERTKGHLGSRETPPLPPP